MIVVVGLSHRTAPLVVREALFFSKEKLPLALERARAETGISEVMILSTCNRVELYAREGDEPLTTALVSFLGSFHDHPVHEMTPYLYRLHGEDAVRHAYRVAASLDSLVLGEPQILGQVKEAYHVAERAGTLGSTLTALRNRSLAAAKRARTETGIGRNAVSISHVAVELARKIFGELKDRQVLLVGAGKMSELAARQLVRSGARATVLGGRAFERAEELAIALGGRAVPFESLRKELALADVVISSTGAPGIVIQKEDIESACSVRHRRPLFLIDIAVPRDIESSAGKMEGVFLYDIDDLKSVAEANLRERQKEAAAAEAIIEREVQEFLSWKKSLSLVPLLIELRQRGDEIRAAEIEKVRSRLGPLNSEQEDALQALTTAIVSKLLHAPTVYLKEVAQNGQPPDQMSLIRKILGL